MPHIGVTVYDLLLSCPGDVLDLKDTIDACVKSFNASIGEANNIRIELKHWSTDSFSLKPEYKKLEIGEEQMRLVSAFCEKHDVKLRRDFYFLGNLQQEIKFNILPTFRENTISYLGSESEQKKYKLFEKLFHKLREYNHVIEYLGSVDAMPCVSLQIQNQGNTFDEDIDVKIFIEKDCFADIDNIPEPGLFFLEEAVELKAPKALFSGNSHADIEDFSNYPVIPYITQSFSNPFKSREEEIAEQQEEYQEMLEYVFCYNLRETEKDDILCFNIPYLKQNTKMFFLMSGYVVLKKSMFGVLLICMNCLRKAEKHRETSEVS